METSVFTVDSALQHTSAELREQVAAGHITAAERDLMIDGAILLAIHLEALIDDARAARPSRAAAAAAAAALAPSAARIAARLRALNWA